MHTLAQLEEALARAAKLGYRIRYENLEGLAGGACELAGQRWLFLDLGLSPAEQLSQVRAALDRLNEPLVANKAGGGK